MRFLPSQGELVALLILWDVSNLCTLQTHSATLRTLCVQLAYKQLSEWTNFGADVDSLDYCRLQEISLPPYLESATYGDFAQPKLRTATRIRAKPAVSTGIRAKNHGGPERAF